MLIFFVAVTLLIRLIIKIVRTDNEFIEYLENKKDFSSLYEFGFYDRNLNRNSRRVFEKFEKIIDKYKKTNDIQYLLYADFIDTVKKKYVILLIVILLDLAFMIFLLKSLGVISK